MIERKSADLLVDAWSLIQICAKALDVPGEEYISRALNIAQEKIEEVIVTEEDDSEDAINIEVTDEE